MTTTQLLSTMAPTLGLAAEQAAPALPELNGWTVEHIDPGAERTAVQPPSAQAVQVELEGLGRLVLAVAGPLARQVQVGPPPAEDLVDGLTPALVKAVASLSQSLSMDLTPGEPREVGADVALLPAQGEMVSAVRLMDGEVHVASLALVHLDEVQAAEEEEVEDVEFHPVHHAPAEITGHPLELLSDVELGVTVELGRTRMLLRDILQLAPGSVIELDRAAGGPVDLLVNNTLIARGEVVVIDEEFGIRITEVVGYGGPAK